MKNVISKKDRVILHLLQYRTISSIRAIELFQLTRLASVIHILRNKGVAIVSHAQAAPSRPVVYELLSPERVISCLHPALQGQGMRYLQVNGAADGQPG